MTLPGGRRINLDKVILVRKAGIIPGWLRGYEKVEVIYEDEGIETFERDAANALIQRFEL